MRNTAVVLGLVGVIAAGCGGGSGGGDVVTPPNADPSGDWLMTSTVNSGSQICENGPPSSFGVRLTVVGDQVYSGSGASCSQYYFGTLSGSTLTYSDSYTYTFYSNYPGYCTYTNTFTRTGTFSGDTYSGTVHATRVVVDSQPNVLGDVCSLIGVPCTEVATETGTRCNGCTGCP